MSGKQHPYWKVVTRWLRYRGFGCAGVVHEHGPLCYLPFIRNGCVWRVMIDGASEGISRGTLKFRTLEAVQQFEAEK